MPRLIHSCQRVPVIVSGVAPGAALLAVVEGQAEAVLLSVDDLEGLEMTLEILGDREAVARISESLAALGRGEPGADLETVRQDLARRRATGR